MKLTKACFKKLSIAASISLFATSGIQIAHAQNIFNLQKSNTSFSIDGGNGGENRQQAYLWNTNNTNINQQWVEIDLGSGHFAYQKLNTNYCLDGGNGASRRQAVILFTCNPTNENQQWKKINTKDGSIRLQKRGFNFSIDSGDGAKKHQTIYLWNSQDNNANQKWNFTPISPSSQTLSFNLDPNNKPWENFDLSDWALDTPNVNPDNGLSAHTTDYDFAKGNLFSGSEPYFFTGSDGAMVFRSNVGGAKTSNDISFPRSELREMLRQGNKSINTQGVNGNNWVLGYQPENVNLEAHANKSQENSTPIKVGGRGGRLTATMSVNRVTSTGNESQVGRVIIGQIHASNDQPLRLYYRKLPGNTLGSIYFTHEIRNNDDLDDFNLVGSSSNNIKNPSDGIALGQIFSYEIINEGSIIEVILRNGDSDGPIIGRGSLDMKKENSGYDVADEWMYFKVGAYTQNNSGNSSDFDEVAIYRLNNRH